MPWPDWGDRAGRDFHSTALVNLSVLPAPTALDPIYPESILVPFPKVAKLEGVLALGERSLARLETGAADVKAATGGMKQWFRLGKSYSVEGGFKTYGLRWGASPKYAKKLEI